MRIQRPMTTHQTENKFQLTAYPRNNTSLLPSLRLRKNYRKRKSARESLALGWRTKKWHFLDSEQPLQYYNHELTTSAITCHRLSKDWFCQLSPWKRQGPTGPYIFLVKHWLIIDPGREKLLLLDGYPLLSPSTSNRELWTHGHTDSSHQFWWVAEWVDTKVRKTFTEERTQDLFPALPQWLKTVFNSSSRTCLVLYLTPWT